MIGTKKNLGLDEIVSIEEAGNIDTYDFNIPITHCYFANGILVHNCLEESAETVILLFWPHFYNENIDRNMYKIIIAKQRNGAVGEHLVNYYPEYFRFEELTLQQKEEIRKQREMVIQARTSFQGSVK